VQVPRRSQGSIYFRYLLEVAGADAWLPRINSLGIDCRKPVFKPLHEYLNLNRADYPNTDRAHRRCVSIPIYPGLKEHEVESILDRIVAC
jgi:dTDP-4-amino-4,6-dideoxygalactose transaminase